MSDVDLSHRKLGSQALIYGLAFVLGRAASFIMLPVYTNFLTPADYGVLGLLQMTVEVAAILLAAGINNGVFRFYFEAETEEEKGRVVVSALVLLEIFNLLTAAVLVVLAPMLAEQVLDGPDSVGLIHIAAASLAFEAFNLIPLIYIQALQQAHVYTLASSGRLVLQLSLNILFVVGFGWGVAGVLYSTLLTNVLVGAALGTLMLRRTGVRIRGTWVRKLLRFGLPYRVTQIGTFLLTFGDRYFLKAYHDLTVTGIYSLAYQFGFILMYLATMPYLQAWNPQRFTLAKLDRRERDRRFNEGLLFLSILITSVATGIALYVEPLLAVLSNEAYHGAAALVPIILAAYVAQSYTDVVELGIQVSGRTEYATAATWISVVTIMALYAVLVPPFGMWGAAFATLIAFVVRFAAFYLFAHRLWPVSYEWGRTALLLAYGASVIGLSLAWRPADWIGQVLWSTTLFACFVLAAAFGGVITASQREGLVDVARERVARVMASTAR